MTTSHIFSNGISQYVANLARHLGRSVIRRPMAFALCIVAVGSSVSGPAVGQVLYPGDLDASYERLLLLMNPHASSPLTHKPSIRRVGEDSLAWNLWSRYTRRPPTEGTLKILDPRIQIGLNTSYPRGYNDGPAWSGKGSNVVLSGGFSGHYKGISYTLAPILSISQNASYKLADSMQTKSRYSYQFERNIDWVQRFGDNAYAILHPGQSEIRATVRNATIGFSSQNFSWGPGQLNHILMSNGGPGFYHVDLGTYRPQPTPIGDMEVTTFWGWLDASKYFDDTNKKHRRLVTGFAFGYAPQFLDGLTIGFHRVMYKDARNLNFEDFIQMIYRFSPRPDTLGDVAINDLFDQMASITFDWKAPKVGFEVYVEYAFNDFNIGERLITETEHARAYTFGLLKTMRVRSNSILTLAVERTTLGVPRTALYRTTPTYYAHSIIEGGYTHLGQLVGAGIGPGGTSDYFGITYYDPRGSLRFDIQRVRLNEDYLAREIRDPDRHDAEFTFGLTGRRFFTRFDVTAALLYSYRFNMHYEETFNLSNLHASVGLRARL